MNRPKHLTPSKGWQRRLMRRLRTRLPLKAPVRLVWRRGVRCDGEFVLGVTSYRVPWSKRGVAGRPIRYRIVVDSRLPASEAWDVIVHEYAHCLDHERRPKPKDCHDTRWGQCYSRVFRASLA